MASELTITPDALKESAHIFRHELLQMPIIALEESLKHMTLRPGVRYKETVGELGGTIQLGPYSDSYKDTGDLTVKGRTLETHFGSVVKEFNPNNVYKSIWGSSITKGEELKGVEAARLVLAYLAGQIGKNLNKYLFTANTADTATAKQHTSEILFDGFDQICKNETASTNTSKGLTSTLGNYGEAASGETAISSSDALERLKAIYRAASDELRSVPTKMFISRTVYDYYLDDYQNTRGSVPYNNGFEQTYLEGSNGLCQLVPLASKAGSKYIQLTTQSNMLVGVDQLSDQESITVEKHSAFTLQFVATMFFGVQFESLSKERLYVYKDI